LAAGDVDGCPDCFPEGADGHPELCCLRWHLGQNQNVPVPAYVEMDAPGLPGSLSCCTPVSSTVVPGRRGARHLPLCGGNYRLRAVNVTGRSVVARPASHAGDEPVDPPID
jgi:hypothetical protein